MNQKNEHGVQINSVSSWRSNLTALTIFISFFFLVTACVSTQSAIQDTVKKAALIAAKPILEKAFYAEAPIAPSNRSLYPTVQILPGSPFSPQKYFHNRQHFLSGTVALPPGDYIIPVVSYCMRSAGSSPDAHRYRLGKLAGKAASAIRDLNAKALSRFNPEDIQLTSWSIQNGIAFEEMPEKSKKIVNTVIPEHRREFEKSSFTGFIEKWNTISDATGMPRFDEVTDSALDSLGDLGESIRTVREFRRNLKASSDYDTFKALISLPGISESSGTESTIPWGKLSEEVYARFITSGHYLDVGELQIRVVKTSRSPQAQKSSLVKIDITTLIADPGVGHIQPLSFSPLQATAAIPLLASADPHLVAAFLAALIASEYIDWQAIEKSLKQWGSSAQQEIKSLVDKLRQMYTKEFGQVPGLIVPPPKVIEAFPDLIPSKQKTPRPGGGLRFRWKDKEGNIYEWDYQHGKLEKYDRRGNHQGEYDPKTGQQTKPKDSKRRVEP